MATEKEATRKFCPRDREQDGYCVGSLCMAWRWSDDGVGRWRIFCPDAYAAVEEGMTRPVRAANWEFAPWDGCDYPAQWLEPKGEYEARREGYCGLAGRP